MAVAPKGLSKGTSLWEKMTSSLSESLSHGEGIQNRVIKKVVDYVGSPEFQIDMMGGGITAPATIIYRGGKIATRKAVRALDVDDLGKSLKTYLRPEAVDVVEAGGENIEEALNIVKRPGSGMVTASIPDRTLLADILERTGMSEKEAVKGLSYFTKNPKEAIKYALGNKSPDVIAVNAPLSLLRKRSLYSGVGRKHLEGQAVLNEGTGMFQQKMHPSQEHFIFDELPLRRELNYGEYFPESHEAIPGSWKEGFDYGYLDPVEFVDMILDPNRKFVNPFIKPQSRW